MPRRLSDVELTDLVPETRTWNNGEPITLEGWINAVGSFEHMIAYGELFWPDFEEFDGCVFRAGVTEENYLAFMEHTGGDRRAVEAVLNHVHVTDLVYRPGGPSEAQAVYLGRLLKEMWEAKLGREFPGRRFVVCFQEQGETSYDFEITFHQDRGGEPTTSASNVV